TLGRVFSVNFLPGTAALTSTQLPSSGSFLKLSGRLLTICHGPSILVACNQDLSDLKYNILVGPYSNKSQFVFTTYRRSRSFIGLQTGSPSRFSRIAGAVA